MWGKISLLGEKIYFKEVTKIQEQLDITCIELHYENNSIETIPDNFDPKCDKLDLSNNKIKDIQVTWNPQNCKYIDLSGNGITYIPKYWKTKASKNSITVKIDDHILYIPLNIRQYYTHYKAKHIKSVVI
jgi:hypothetical protein